MSLLSLNLPEESSVKIEIINLTGNKMDKLVDNKLTGGNYCYIINPEKYESGTYYLVFTINGVASSMKLIILK